MEIDLGEILTPTCESEGRWNGRPGPAMGPRLFGGQAVAQALLSAAGEECGDRLPHSLHAHFLKAGSAAEPVNYQVTTLAEGRSFATRRIDARQGELLIFTATVSFHINEPGYSHQQDSPYPLDIAASLAALQSWKTHNKDAGKSPIVERLQGRPIEIVPLDPGSIFGTRSREPRTGCWMRMRSETASGPLMHRALLAYASDMMFLRNALLPHSIRPGSNQLQAASLDHAIWFHETPDFNRWHLFATDSPWAGSARGLNRGHFFAEDGRLVATVAQENLMRPLAPRTDEGKLADAAR
ncbi:acyl-CoA thioesterase [Altererythrobacter sp.]|uniref:acyl-CoA thioesterase n=1 Tax=Altererythrobacter sp. TaxID=1872480 RepID=UPI003D081A71